MKLHLYLVLDLDQYENLDDLHKIRVMTQDDLREEFKLALDNHRIPQQEIDDYMSDPDYANEDWEYPRTELRIGTVVDIMNDIINYVQGCGYYIIETDLNTKD